MPHQQQASFEELGEDLPASFSSEEELMWKFQMGQIENFTCNVMTSQVSNYLDLIHLYLSSPFVASFVA